MVGECAAPVVGAQPCAALREHLPGAGAQVPLPPEDALFLDPSAVAPLDAPSLGQGLQFFLCCVPSAPLNSTLQQRAIASGGPPLKASLRNRIHLSHIRDSETTILMVEMRTIAGELKRQDPHFGRTLNRHRADWDRFAVRHVDGGHMLFADGSARHVTNGSATTDRQGSRDPDTPGGDWNTARLTWDPLGPAID